MQLEQVARDLHDEAAVGVGQDAVGEACPAAKRAVCVAIVDFGDDVKLRVGVDWVVAQGSPRAPCRCRSRRRRDPRDHDAPGSARKQQRRREWWISIKGGADGCGGGGHPGGLIVLAVEIGACPERTAWSAALQLQDGFVARTPVARGKARATGHVGL